MPPRTLALLLALLAFVSGTPAPAQQRAAVDARTAAELGRFRSDHARSMLRRAPDLAARYYARGIRLMPQYQQTVMGDSNALAYHRAFLDRFDVHRYGRTEMEVLDLGARVVELGTFTMRVARRGASDAHELRGTYQDFWERRDDGTLALVTQAWNYSHPVAIAGQLRFDQVPAVHVALAAHLPVDGGVSFELAGLNRLLETTIAQHDPTVWSHFYADDVRLVYSHHPVYEGRAAVAAFLAEHVKGLPVFEKLDVRTDRIDDLGRYVVEYASHIAAYRAGSQSGVSTGKNVTIWRRGANGSLKIFRSMAMYD